MKSWKEVPHLFVGGGFKIRFGKKIVTALSHFQLGQVIANPDWYTLIARKIEDMTEEEVNSSPHSKDGYYSIRWHKSVLKSEAKNNTMYAKDERYLLSIGVYPFDQSHFDNGEVIDIKTL